MPSTPPSRSLGNTPLSTVWVSPDLESAVVDAESTHPDPAVRRLPTTPALDEATTPIFDIQLMSAGEGG
ncbi:hypothetical protein [Georgenia sp. Marseille-Q6866]